MLARPSTSSSNEAPEGVNTNVRRDVTVIIAAWRAAGTIGRAVASALAQPEVRPDCSGADRWRIHTQTTHQHAGTLVSEGGKCRLSGTHSTVGSGDPGRGSTGDSAVEGLVFVRQL